TQLLSGPDAMETQLLDRGGLAQDAGNAAADNDKTVASPALGYGMERKNMLDPFEDVGQSQDESSQEPFVVAADPAEQMVDADPLLPIIGADEVPQPVNPAEASRARLSRREVAAVSEDRAYYEGGATPYLSQRQAQEKAEETRKRHSRIRVILVTLFILVAMGVGGWFIWQSLSKPPAPPVPEYQTANIEQGEFLEIVDKTSQVSPLDEQDVSTEASGSLSSALVSNGDHVDEGQELFHLESPTIRDAARRAQDALDAAQADTDARVRALEQAQQNLSNEEKQVENLKKSANSTNSNSNSNTTTDSGAASKAAIAAAEAVLEQARRNVEDAENRVRDSETTLQAVQETYNLAHEQELKLIVRAPISGTVEGIDSELKEGDNIANGERLCRVLDKSAMRLELELSQDEAQSVKEGNEVRLTFPAVADLGTITTEVDSVEEPEDEDEEAPVVVTIFIEDPDERITPNMEAKASIVLQSIPNQLIVPLDSVKTDDDNSTYLNILIDSTRGIVSKVPVRVVAKNKTQAAVSADNIQKDNTVVLDDVEHTSSQQEESSKTDEQPKEEESKDESEESGQEESSEEEHTEDEGEQE
ncbi:MAG: efflux RND transporter periplasmic adaptor subunit, partial [Coriobacteriales bacterium]|nr:efflux RND transporter periplasmic adaptor subunit [Coriobacteriales bacterium]